MKVTVTVELCGYNGSHQRTIRTMDELLELSGKMGFYALDQILEQAIAVAEGIIEKSPVEPRCGCHRKETA